MKIEIEIADLQRLYDLATDSPLICSGNFETDDVRVLRRLALKIGADITAATPDEFVRDFPHAFEPPSHRTERRYNGYRGVPLGTPLWETEEQVLTRLGGSYPDACTAGRGARRCNRPADHPLHHPDAPEPTSDPDAMADEE